MAHRTLASWAMTSPGAQTEEAWTIPAHAGDLPSDGGQAPVITVAIAEPFSLRDHFMNHTPVLPSDTTAGLKRLEGGRRGGFEPSAVISREITVLNGLNPPGNNMLD